MAQLSIDPRNPYEILADIRQAITDLWGEEFYEGGEKQEGISVRFLARLTMLRLEAGLISDSDPMVSEAVQILNLQHLSRSVTP